jgi:hypothetical protein
LLSKIPASFQVLDEDFGYSQPYMLLHRRSLGGTM